MLQLISLLTGVHWRDQGPAFLVGFGHGGTHWVAAFFYLLLPYITRDLGLSYAQAGLLVSIFHLSSLLTNFGSGLMVDITGRRVSFQIASLLIGAGALFAFGVSEQFLVLAFLVMLIGASNNLWHQKARDSADAWWAWRDRTRDRGPFDVAARRRERHLCDIVRAGDQLRQHSGRRWFTFPGRRDSCQTHGCRGRVGRRRVPLYANLSLHYVADSAHRAGEDICCS